MMSFAAAPIGLGFFNHPVPAVLSGLLTVPTFDEFEDGFDGWSQGDYDFPADCRIDVVGLFPGNESSSEGAIHASGSLVDVNGWFEFERPEFFQTPMMSPLNFECPGAPHKAGVESAPDSFSMEGIFCDDADSLSPYFFADISLFETGLLAFQPEKTLVRRKALRRPHKPIYDNVTLRPHQHL